MEPIIKRYRDDIREEYPNACFDCAYIRYNVDWFIRDKPLKICTPAQCTLDYYERECTGKCSKYKKEFIYKIIDLFKKIKRS